MVMPLGLKEALCWPKFTIGNDTNTWRGWSHMVLYVDSQALFAFSNHRNVHLGQNSIKRFMNIVYIVVKINEHSRIN